jgi:hypothetical protein
MALPTVTLNETAPAGGAYVRDGNDRIVEYKIQVREILAIDHYFPSSGQNDACGRHKRITLIEAADIGAVPATWVGTESTAILGAQTVSGKPELCYSDEDSTDVILTDVGKIALQNSRLPNNTYLIGRNAAGAANVNMLKVNASDIIEFATFPITPSAAPDANYEVANKKYVDDSVPAFGAWVDKSSSYAAQQAATDGFVVISASQTNGTVSTVDCYTDVNANPTTLRGKFKLLWQGDYLPMGYGNFTMPVKKSDYWKIVVTGTPTTITVYWIPLGV